MINPLGSPQFVSLKCKLRKGKTTKKKEHKTDKNTAEKEEQNERNNQTKQNKRKYV